ncbi:MAG: cyanophycin synthetase, partial [Candidatus Omnitrophota bacterium]
HTQKLGSTLKEIATEKAGIIKSHSVTTSPRHQVIVVSAPQEKEVKKVISKKCKEAKAKLYEVNRDIFYESRAFDFDIIGVFHEYPCLKIRLLGKHQLINVAVAVGAIEALRFYDTYIDIDSVRQGLYNTIWPGRCEVVSTEPVIILDGAQNVASSKVLVETLKGRFRYRKLYLILGVSEDKDIKGVCRKLRELADEVFLTRADNPRAAEPQALAGYFEHKKVHITNNVKEAQRLARLTAKKEDLILVTGSLFVVGEARKLILGKDN